MNKLEKLREEVRAIVAAYDPAEDFEITVHKLAAIGFAMEDAMREI